MKRETQQTEVTLVKLEVWRQKTGSCLKAAFWTAVLKPVNVLLNSFFSEVASLFFYTLTANFSANIENAARGCEYVD